MKKKFYIALATASIILLGTMAGVEIVSANTSIFLPNARTATATTSAAYITAGLGTSTLSYDTYAAVNGGQIKAADSAAVLIQYAASSSASQLAWHYEYSMDGIDWYGDSLSAGATTTQTIDESSYTSYRWNYASTTFGTSVSGQAFKIVNVPTPTRFVRIVFSVPIGFSPASVWAQFVPKRQSNP